ncbi:MAG: sensor histidine kinase, partial [Nevskiaceae bacterium]
VTARGDELGELARDVDGMAERIERLLASRQQLMRDMSHELRSPLARLQAALALAERKQPLPAIEYARIVTELERMNQAIGDVLRFTRLEAEPIRAKHLLRIDELLQTLVEDERVEAGTREVLLALDAAPDLTVVGDPALLRSGFENILRNAIRHAPPDTCIDIRATHEQALGESPTDMVAISIEYRGSGVPDDMLEKIFEPYTRLTSAGDDTTGTGLGLAIARRVFTAHDGQIHAEPAVPCGLRVRIQLPRAC